MRPRDPLRRRWSQQRAGENLRCLKPEAYKIRRPAKPNSPRFRLPAAETFAEGVKNPRGQLGLQRVPDGVLHGLQGVFRATPVSATALGDVGLAPTAPA